MSALVNTELRSSLTVPAIVPLPVCAEAVVSQKTWHKIVAKKSECSGLRITLPPIFVFLLRLVAESGEVGLCEPNAYLQGTVSREGER